MLGGLVAYMFLVTAVVLVRAFVNNALSYTDIDLEIGEYELEETQERLPKYELIESRPLPYEEVAYASTPVVLAVEVDVSIGLDEDKSDYDGGP